jgi:hypothetical protein
MMTDATDARSQFEAACGKLAELSRSQADLARQHDEIWKRMTDLSLEMGDVTIEAITKGRAAGAFTPERWELMRRVAAS